MRRAAFTAVIVCVLVSAATASGRGGGTTISGAGSTFVAPLVAQWISPLKSAYGYDLQYTGIGSGGGIAAITDRTVDFGASDAPLTRDQFAACKRCVQIPWALSATSVIYNLKGIKSLLHMSGPVLAAIYSGKIAKWNDPAIRKLNKGVALPDQRISVFYRSDNSGTTYNFTDYLASVSPAWKSRTGVGVAVSWPTGVGGKGSSGVAAGVAQTPGGIGYVDVAYALASHAQYFAVENRSGAFATPGLRGIAAAAASDVKPDATGALSIVNPPATYPVSYPISTYTYVLVPLTSPKAAALKTFLTWAVTKGQQFGPRLLFQPLPKGVVAAAKKSVAKIHA